MPRQEDGLGSAHLGAQSSGRLRGWKRIAQHLGVTQSTAIRWSKSADFPLIKVENGGSVYADAAQLDAWLVSRQTSTGAPISSEDGAERPSAAAPIALRQGLLRNPIMWAACLVLFVALAVMISHQLSASHQNRVTQSSGNAALDERYRQARSAWASRTADGVTSAVTQFRAIVAEDPGFVPGLTGLADAYILSCEFGDVDRGVAFHDAERVVDVALALDSEDADANRIKGFLLYWHGRNFADAKTRFDRSLASDAEDYLAYLWYGNVLIDAGRIADGKAMLDKAIVLAPESTAVATDYAYALWQHGDSADALATLHRLQLQNPENPVPFSYAAMFQLAQGNVPEYLAMSRRWAEVIDDPRQIQRVAEEARLFQSGGRLATLRRIADTLPVGNSPSWHGGNLPAAIAASHLGDRALLIAILTRRDQYVDVSKENWRPLRFPLEPFLKWRSDAGVAPLLLRQFHISSLPDR